MACRTRTLDVGGHFADGEWIAVWSMRFPRLLFLPPSIREGSGYVGYGVPWCVQEAGIRLPRPPILVSTGPRDQNKTRAWRQAVHMALGSCGRLPNASDGSHRPAKRASGDDIMGIVFLAAPDPSAVRAAPPSWRAGSYGLRVATIYAAPHSSFLTASGPNELTAVEQTNLDGLSVPCWSTHLDPSCFGGDGPPPQGMMVCAAPSWLPSWILWSLG